jgi:hypothetical protein
MIENTEELNIDKSKIGVGGDSAGGNLAAGISLRARDEKVSLAYQLLIYPATRLDFDTDSYLNNADGYGLRRKGMMWFWDQYLNTGDKNNPYAVPDIAPDHRGLASAIIPTAEYDVLRDDGNGIPDLKRIILIKYQAICVGFDAPIEMVTLYVLSLTIFILIFKHLMMQYILLVAASMDLLYLM